MSGQTVINYTGGLPADGANVLFNSITAFPPGGSLHLLGQKWIAVSVAADTGTTNTITAEYSNAGRSTGSGDWVLFYTSGSVDLTGGSLATFRDEIYIAGYKDVRVLFNSNGAQTAFQANLALLCEKATSQAIPTGATADTLGGQAYPITDT